MSKEQKNNEAKKLPGFYIALCCCVLVIGVAGYFTERNTNKTQNVINSDVVSENASENSAFSEDIEEYTSSALAQATPAADESEEETVSSTNGELPVVSEPQPIEEYAVDNPDVEETAIIVSSEQPAFIIPVSGDVLEGYSEGLVYNSALGDWRAHSGIDIKAAKGCSIQSASDGVIDEISEDVRGKYVVISHAAGFVTKYMGLENIENLTVGKEIKSGEVIGTLGDCKGENIAEPHLHFELVKDGESVNPSDYLPH